MISYKYGKKVKVKIYNKRPIFWSSDGGMDKFMGQIVTMNNCVGKHKWVKIKEDKDRWVWKEEDFEEIDIFKQLSNKDFEI